MKQFGRRWKLDISNDQETLSIEQLRVAFEIDKTINEKPNPAKIQVWNLNRDHINQLLSQDYKKVALSVGYGELRQIYAGDITKTRIQREGLDFVLTLECSDGHQAYTQSRAQTTLKAGATDKQIVEELQKTMPKVQSGAIDIPNQRKLPRGRVLNGNSRDILTKIARNNKADWSIQDGSLIFLPKDKVLSDDAVLISQDTGMINAPEQTDEGLELTCLLNPALQIGGLVKVESIIDYFNGEYKVVKLAHSGDGIGGDWRSKITVVGGKFQKVEKEKSGQKSDKQSKDKKK
jgi:genome|nr:MAG TPA: 43 kDa tail protein [Caudoviricetes sp.]